MYVRFTSARRLRFSRVHYLPRHLGLARWISIRATKIHHGFPPQAPTPNLAHNAFTRQHHTNKNSKEYPDSTSEDPDTEDPPFSYKTNISTPIAPPGTDPSELDYAKDTSEATIYNPNAEFLRSTKTRLAPSPEQQHVIDMSLRGNVIVSARPGSGKTATAEAIVAAAASRGERVAILTYSRRLMVEARARLGGKYSNVEIWTFHGMAGKLFGEVVLTDTVLTRKRRELERGEIPVPEMDGSGGASFDVVVVDEFQDCTDLLFWLVCVFVQVNQRGLGRAARLVILGDERQAIYDFRGADARYLTLAPELFGSLADGLPWMRASLSQSFRLSHQVAAFVNNVYLSGDQYIVGSKAGPRPIFLHVRPTGYVPMILKLCALIKRYGAHNTAILAPVIRNQNYVAKLSNALGSLGVPIAVQISDEVPIDDRVIEGKLSISTIHQFKGSERDLVIVMGCANQSYFSRIRKDVLDTHCTNDLFVAMTRARKQLVVLYNHKEELMRYLNPRDIINHCVWDHTSDIDPSEHVLECGPAPGRQAIEGLNLPLMANVVGIVRHLKEEHMTKLISKYLDVIELREPLLRDQIIRSPLIVASKWTINGEETALGLAEYQHNGKKPPIYPQCEWNFHEGVADLNALAMVASAEYLLFGTMNAVNCGNFCDDGVSLEPIDLGSPFKAKPVRALCKRTCVYDAMNSGFWARHRSLKGHNFDWIKPRVLYKGARRLREELEASGNVLGMTFEFSLSDNSFEGKDYRMRIVGKVDIVTIEMPSRFKTSRKASGVPHWHVRNPFADEFRGMKKTLWEIKFTESLTSAHVIQTAIYAWMYAQVSVSKKPPDRTFLFNVRTGQKLEIRAKRQQPQARDGAGDGENELQGFMEELIWRKYLVEQKLDDEAFVEQCKKIRQAAIDAVEKGVQRERRTGRVEFFGVTPSVIVEDEDRERYDADGK